MADKYHIDPNWCFENPGDAAEEIARLHKCCDTLAAHVERLKVAFDKATTWEDVREIFESAPTTTSLARLISEKQAEVLEEASYEFEVHERARQVLQWKAHIIRRQAEEPARHEWDWETGAGERCVKCGDKDWMADPVCSESKLCHQAEGGER